MAVFKIKQDKDDSLTNLEYKTIDINGQSVDPNGITGVAKCVYDVAEDNNTYFIKYSTSGRDQGLLYSPVGQYVVDISTRNLETNKMHYQYKKVSKKCYDLYLGFIKNRDPLALKNAQREANYA